jgi:hypothetical protein
MNLIALPAFNDRCIRIPNDGVCAVNVDPGEPEPVTTARATLRPDVAAILVTPEDGEPETLFAAPCARMGALR